ncbi:hypothetical protein BDV06DRAFT_232415 [Aspergillus oleicola]
MGETSPTPHQLLVEAVVFWSIGVVIYIGRIVARCISNGGIRHLQIDDYIMTLTFAVYTTLLVLIRVSAKYATNLYPASEEEDILANPDDVKARIYGSKIVIGLEQCMLISTWGVKTCLVTMYWKLTHRLPWHIFVQILAGYVALGFIVIEVTYFAVYCRPFSQYWAVPVDNPQQSSTFDACMLVIPVPLLKGALMPIRKKILLISVLGLGVFVMIAAILNKYFNFASPDTTIYQLWYIREASTAIYVANLMCWWPLLRKIFGNALSHYNSRYRSNRYGDHPSGQLSHSLPFGSAAAAAGASHNVTQTSTVGKQSRGRSKSRGNWWWGRRTPAESNGLATTASQEAINNSEEVPLEIWRKVEYNVEQNTDSQPSP